MVYASSGTDRYFDRRPLILWIPYLYLTRMATNYWRWDRLERCFMEKIAIPLSSHWNTCRQRPKSQAAEYSARCTAPLWNVVCPRWTGRPGKDARLLECPISQVSNRVWYPCWSYDWSMPGIYSCGDSRSHSMKQARFRRYEIRTTL